jgi:hypothetical protein
MNCTEFNNYLTDGTDRELDAPEQAAFDAHRASCAACQAVYASELEILAGLRAMPIVEPPAGFADRVLANAYKSAITQDTSRQKNHHRQGFMLGFGSAAAAALAMWVVVGMSPDELPVATNAPEQAVARVEAASPVLDIALNTERTIKLAFASGESLQGAKITIRLPENVALVGYPGRRELSWQTNLKKGDNLLSLPVLATQVASGELVADIEYQGRVKTLRLNLKTNAAGASLKDIKFQPSVG